MARFGFDDELEDDELMTDATGINTEQPHSDITDRPPLQDMSLPGIAAAMPQNERSKAVQQMIASRRDPLMQELNQSQSRSLDRQKAQSDFQNRMAMYGALSNLSAGVNKPQENPVINTLSKQAAQEDVMAEKADQKRLDVMKAIETRKALASRYGNVQDRFDKNREMAVNRIMGQALQRINNHPVLKPSMMNLESLNKSIKMLSNPKLPITPQVLSDAEQDAAGAMNLRGSGATEGKIHRSEIQSMSRKFAELAQKYAGQPDIDLRKVDPKLVDTVLNFNRALYDDYLDTVKTKKAEALDEFRAAYGSDPDINQRLDKLGATFDKYTKPAEVAQSFPMKVTRKNPETGILQSAMVSNDEELKQAQAKGFQ
jgi:hypothetical protein